MLLLPTTPAPHAADAAHFTLAPALAPAPAPAPAVPEPCLAAWAAPHADSVSRPSHCSKLDKRARRQRPGPEEAEGSRGARQGPQGWRCACHLMPHCRVPCAACRLPLVAPLAPLPRSRRLSPRESRARQSTHPPHCTTPAVRKLRSTHVAQLCSMCVGVANSLRVCPGQVQLVQALVVATGLARAKERSRNVPKRMSPPSSCSSTRASCTSAPRAVATQVTVRRSSGAATTTAASRRTRRSLCGRRAEFARAREPLVAAS